MTGTVRKPCLPRVGVPDPTKCLFIFIIHHSILPVEEGGGYLIEFPDLPGCMSDGETIEETIENGKDAVACWIETAKRYGDKNLSTWIHYASFASAKILLSNHCPK